MKKIIGFVLALVVLGAAYAVIRPQLPEWTVSVMMSHLQNGHYEELLADSDLTEVEKNLIRHAVDNSSFEITGSVIEGRQATVFVELTFVDLRELVIGNRQQLMSNAFGNLGSILSGVLGGAITDTAFEQLLLLFEDEGIELPLKTRQVKVALDQQALWFAPDMETTRSHFFQLFQEELQLNLLDLLQ